MALMVVLFAAAWPSHAQQWPGRRADKAEQMRPQPPPPQQPPGGRDARDMRDRNGGPQRPGYLSPEERRQLRRDISDHGRDIYRDRGRR